MSNGRRFTPAEDALILANPQLGGWKLGKILGRAHQSVRSRREKLYGGEPPIIRPNHHTRRRRRAVDRFEAEISPAAVRGEE